jgi:hypothetical protein
MAREAVDAATKAASGANGPYFGVNPEENVMAGAGRQGDADFVKNAIDGHMPNSTGGANYTGEFRRISNELSKVSNEIARANDLNSSKWESPDFVSKVKQQLQRVTKLVENLAANPDVDQSQLMLIQYEVMQMSIVLDVSSKVGDKSSQALQSLFRNQ